MKNTDKGVQTEAIILLKYSRDWSTVPGHNIPRNNESCLDLWVCDVGCPQRVRLGHRGRAFCQRDETIARRVYLEVCPRRVPSKQRALHRRPSDPMSASTALRASIKPALRLSSGTVSPSSPPRAQSPPVPLSSFRFSLYPDATDEPPPHLPALAARPRRRPSPSPGRRGLRREEGREG